MQSRETTIVSRRVFVATASCSIAAPFGAAALAQSSAGTSAGDGPSPLPKGFPSQDPKLVAEIVGKSHFDLDAVTKLVEARPELARASYDWGFGDWETALGAASHVGRRDIADVLIAHGARPDIFTFTMFGNLDAVRAIIEANPGVQRIPGPHGITLLAHAKAGGEPAAAVYEYLTKLGDADPVPTDLPVPPELKAAMLGTYAYEVVSGTCSIIETRSGALAFKHEPDGSARNLRHQGNGAFHPAGAPRVRIAFADGKLMIEDGALKLDARKR